MSTHAETWLAHAMLYVERFGMSVIPMTEDKKPAIKWAEFQERRPTVKELLDWPKMNLAIVTGAISGICVIDCESREDAEWFWRNRGTSPAIVQTKRGFHLYFRHPGEKVMNGTHIEDRYDVRGDGGYVLAPPSRHSEGAYKWVKPLVAATTLPMFDPAWRPIRNSPDNGAEDREIRNAVKYISCIKAVSGQSGHNETYRAACVLRSAGFSEGAALLALQDWNKTNADPPWSDRELLHKIRSAFS